MLLSALGRLWLRGVAVDWAGFYAHEHAAAPAAADLSLRAPALLGRCDHPPAALSPQPSAERKAEIADWFYSPSWKRSLLPAPLRTQAPAPHNSTAASETWLLLADSGDLATQLAQRLSGAGRSVVLARPAAQFARVGDCIYTLDPRRREAMPPCSTSSTPAATYPDPIVHCASITRDLPHAANATTFQQHQGSAFYSLIFLAQALEDKQTRFAPALGGVEQCLPGGERRHDRSRQGDDPEPM